jgi:hypothetical protein
MQRVMLNAMNPRQAKKIYIQVSDEIVVKKLPPVLVTVAFELYSKQILALWQSKQLASTFEQLRQARADI